MMTLEYPVVINSPEELQTIINDALGEDDLRYLFRPLEDDPQLMSIWEGVTVSVSTQRTVEDALRRSSVVEHIEEKFRLQNGFHDRLKKLEDRGRRGAMVLKVLRRARAITGPTIWNVLVKVTPSRYRMWVARASRPGVTDSPEYQFRSSGRLP